MFTLFILILPLLLFLFYYANQSLIHLYFLDEETRLRHLSQELALSPSSTIFFHVPIGGVGHVIVTANPDNIRHILKTRFSTYKKGNHFMVLKTRFSTYKKGNHFMVTYGDLFGHSIFTVDDDQWRFQRQLLCPCFSIGSIKSFLDTIVEFEISYRLLPTLSGTTEEGGVTNLEDVFKRFALDTTFRFLLGYDPLSLSQPLRLSDFINAYEEAFLICSERVRSVSSIVWKLEKLFNVGFQKRLMEAVSKARAFARTVNEHKRRNLHHEEKFKDALSRLHDKGTKPGLMVDVIIATILAGRDSLSHALSRFFLLLATHPRVEEEVLKEVKSFKDCKESLHSQVKTMVYTRATIYEAMRLDPPFPEEMKEATEDDVLPDGTRVRKGTEVIYSISSMGRSERIWGKDCEEFSPERWLEWDVLRDGWKFVPRDQYTYPVFNAGPRICLGKELAFMQMKAVITFVMKRFKLVVVSSSAGVGNEYQVRVVERR